MKWIVLIAFVLLLAANETSCVGGGGLYVRVDGVQHAFAWGEVKNERK